jgi:preprotein translocase subunit SecE
VKSFIIVALMVMVVAAIMGGIDLINGGYDLPEIQYPL